MVRELLKRGADGAARMYGVSAKHEGRCLTLQDSVFAFGHLGFVLYCASLLDLNQLLLYFFACLSIQSPDWQL